jgi:hypothetical protein
MLETLTATELVALIVWALTNIGALFAAFRAWVQSSQARILSQETLDAILIDLREDLADAVAEGASQVIAEVKARSALGGAVKQ